MRAVQCVAAPLSAGQVVTERCSPHPQPVFRSVTFSWQAVHLMRRGAIGVAEPLDYSKLGALGSIHWDGHGFKVMPRLRHLLCTMCVILPLALPVILCSQ